MDSFLGFWTKSIILPNGLHLVVNQYIFVKKLNSNILYTFIQKTVTWIGHILDYFSPRELNSASLMKTYFLDINARISSGLHYKLGIKFSFPG